MTDIPKCLKVGILDGLKTKDIKIRDYRAYTHPCFLEIPDTSSHPQYQFVLLRFPYHHTFAPSTPSSCSLILRKRKPYTIRKKETLLKSHEELRTTGSFYWMSNLLPLSIVLPHPSPFWAQLILGVSCNTQQFLLNFHLRGEFQPNLRILTTNSHFILTSQSIVTSQSISLSHRYSTTFVESVVSRAGWTGKKCKWSRFRQSSSTPPSAQRFSALRGSVFYTQRKGDKLSTRLYPDVLIATRIQTSIDAASTLNQILIITEKSCWNLLISNCVRFSNLFTSSPLVTGKSSWPNSFITA